MNLISNSVKYTIKGKIHILLDDFDEYTIIVKVIDNGAGIVTDKYFYSILVKGRFQAGLSLLVIKILKLHRALDWV